MDASVSTELGHSPKRPKNKDDGHLRFIRSPFAPDSKQQNAALRGWRRRPPIRCHWSVRWPAAIDAIAASLTVFHGVIKSDRPSQFHRWLACASMQAACRVNIQRPVRSRAQCCLTPRSRGEAQQPGPLHGLWYSPLRGPVCRPRLSSNVRRPKFTPMTITADTLKQITSGKFSLEFLRARLTQQRESDPVIYGGPGSVEQDDDGSLTLKIYHLFDSSSTVVSEINAMGIRSPSGKLIDRSDYFSLEGTDPHGAKWTAHNLWLSRNISFPTGGAVISSKLQNIQTVREIQSPTQERKHITKFFIPGKHKIPTTGIKQHQFKPPTSICEIQLDDRKCTLAQGESHLEVSVEAGDSQSTEDVLHGVLESLSIAFGRRLLPQVEITRTSIEVRETISSRRIDEEEYILPPPIPASHGEDAKNLQELMSALSSKDRDFSLVQGYCYRVLRSFSGDVENSALVLTTSIEGLLKSYFEDAGKPDEEF